MSLASCAKSSSVGNLSVSIFTRQPTQNLVLAMSTPDPVNEVPGSFVVHPPGGLVPLRLALLSKADVEHLTVDCAGRDPKILSHGFCPHGWVHHGQYSVAFLGPETLFPALLFGDSGVYFLLRHKGGIHFGPRNARYRKIAAHVIKAAREKNIPALTVKCP